MLTISYQLTYYSVCLNSFHNAFYLFWKSLPDSDEKLVCDILSL